jgi:hypothetical protein
LFHLDGQVHHDTHALPMGNYVIEVRNYVIATPSELGNYKIADTQATAGGAAQMADDAERDYDAKRSKYLCRRAPISLSPGRPGCPQLIRLQRGSTTGPCVTPTAPASGMGAGSCNQASPSRSNRRRKRIGRKLPHPKIDGEPQPCQAEIKG